jgi:hypothetical protein
MTWQVTGKQKFPAVIGEPFGGGFFAGYISHTADGNPTHALIVAPRATGATGTGYTLTTNLAWKTESTTTDGTTSAFDGAANTAAMVTAGIANHPAAQFCVNLSIGGYTDWYLPARLELDIAYFNLKPGTQLNIPQTSWGINAYSVPKRDTRWTESYPSQTFVADFKTGGSQPFEPQAHYSSTEATATQGWGHHFDVGYQTSFAFTAPKTNTGRVRAFRRIAL